MASISEIFTSMEYGPAPEAAAPAREWIAEHDGKFGHFINGKWARPSGGEIFTTVNPATGKPLAKVAQGSGRDVSAAVKAARSAQPAWEKLGGHGRARHLYALARMLQKHARLFAVLESLDNGKPIRETRDLDVPLVVRLDGNNAELGRKILAAANLPGLEQLDTMDGAARRAAELAAS